MSSKTLNVILKATENCNLRCRYCYNCDSEYSKAVLPAEDLKKFFDMAADEYDAVSIVWHGGEPLLCGMDYMENAMQMQKDIFSEKGIVFSNSVQTNGTLINKKWLKFFRKNDFSVGVSFDGIGNSKYRQETERTLAAIRLMKRCKLRFGCLSVVADEDTDFSANYEFFKSLRVPYVLSPVFSEGGAKDMAGISADVFIKKAKDLFDIWLYDTDGVSVRLFTEYAAMTMGSTQRLCTNGSCHGKWIGITPDGNLYNCGRESIKEYCFGNIRSINKISDAFHSEGFIRLLTGAIERRKKCRDKCSCYTYCQSHCSDCAVIENGIDSIPSFSCRCFREIFTYVQSAVRDITEKHTPLDTLNPSFRDIAIRCMGE